MSALAIILAIVAWMVVVTGVLVVMTVRSQKKRLRLGHERNARLGAALGLEASSTAGQQWRVRRLQGTRGGLAVRVGTNVMRLPEGNNRGPAGPLSELWVEVGLTPPLGIGLRMRSVSGPWGGATLSTRIEPLFEPRPDGLHPFYADAHDLDRAARLVETPYVAEALFALDARAVGIVCTDSTVQLAVKGAPLEPGSIAPLLDSAIDLARRVMAAHAELGAAKVDVAMEAAMKAVAARWGLQLEPEQLALRGRIDGAKVEALVVLSGARRETHFVGHFEQPLGLALRLRKQTLPWKFDAILGGQDIETGDAVFDKRFVVEGKPVAAVRAALGPALRQQLSALQDVSRELRVEDHGVLARVANPVYDPAALEHGLRSIAAVVNALERSRRPQR